MVCWKGWPKLDCTGISRDELQRLDPDSFEHYQNGMDITHLSCEFTRDRGDIALTRQPYGWMMGIHFLLIDLLQEHLGLYLTGLSFSHPRGAGANTEHGCKDFFSVVSILGTPFTTPLFQTLLFLIDSHFTSWHFQNLNTYFYCYWVIYNVLMSNSNLWSLLKGHSTNVLSRAFWIKIFSGGDSKHP